MAVTIIFENIGNLSNSYSYYVVVFFINWVFTSGKYVCMYVHAYEKHEIMSEYIIHFLLNTDTGRMWPKTNFKVEINRF